MSTVLDVSVAAAWFFPDEVNPYTETVLERLQDTGALVPQIWILEMANTLLAAERRKRLAQVQTTQILQVLQDLPISVAEGVSMAAMGSILAVARQYSLSAYDASYLQLALHEGLPLATQDERLRAAARRVGVPPAQ